MRNFLFLILIVVALPALGQRSKNVFKLSLTKKEKQTYILNVNQSKISKVRDTTFGDKRKWKYVTAEVRLSNLDDDTLTYINMTCSTYDIFTLNNKNISIRRWGCDYNIPHEYKIPPHKNSVFNFTLYFDKNQADQKFSFGIYLIKPETKHWYFDVIDSLLKSKRDLFEPKNSFKDCLIWSNEVTISK